MINWCKCLALSLVAALFCLTPTWIFLGIRRLADPEGFWQELAVGIIGYVVLGGFQVLCLVGFVFALVLIWGWVKENLDEDKLRRPKTKTRA